MSLLRRASTRLSLRSQLLIAPAGEIAGAADIISGATERLQDDLVGVAEVAERSSSASQQVSASTEESSAATQQIAASASDLTEAAGRLEQMVAQFSLSPSA